MAVESVSPNTFLPLLSVSRQLEQFVVRILNVAFFVILSLRGLNDHVRSNLTSFLGIGDNLIYDEIESSDQDRFFKKLYEFLLGIWNFIYFYSS